MRQCTVKDFKSRNFDFKNEFHDHIEQRLCPDIEKDDFYQVQGAYSNQTLRNSFSVEILKCSDQISTTCKSDPEIELLLSKIFFTLYTLDSSVSYNHYNKQNKPVRTYDSFHS